MLTRMEVINVSFTSMVKLVYMGLFEEALHVSRSVKMRRRHDRLALALTGSCVELHNNTDLHSRVNSVHVCAK